MTATGPLRPTEISFEVVDDLAGEFAEQLVEAFHSRPGELFQIGLTGGACARRCYGRLARHAETQIDWWLVDAWWVDELDVDPGHPDSHYGMARSVLFDAVGAAYALHPLAAAGSADERAGPLPDRFDVVHLDLDVDGSLYCRGGRRLPASAVEGAELVVVTVAGADRREALRAVRDGLDVPGAGLGGSRQRWLVDHAAAG